MKFKLDDIRIREIREVSPPCEVRAELPITEKAAENVYYARETIRRILNKEDDRLLVVIGPCSIHDPRAALEYASRLKGQAAQFSEELFVVMRVYFEKPRTRHGWKGLINDPDLNETFNINKGLRLARKLLLELNELGMPAATEYLDLITPQYVSDLISWGAIGARTTESQVHRELASGLSCPVGFKNATDGNVKVAIDAIAAASRPHHFLSLTKEGKAAIFATTGNPDTHLILRGGKRPNYDAESVADACEALEGAGLPVRVMIDFSHGNSLKQHRRQLIVGEDVAKQIAFGDRRIIGVMIESFLVEGRQDLQPGKPLVFGQSITDACLGWEDSANLLQSLAKAVRERRKVAA